MIQVLTEFTFGDKEHLPNSLCLTQPLSIIEETRPGAKRTLGVVIGGGGVSEDSGAVCWR